MPVRHPLRRAEQLQATSPLEETYLRAVSQGVQWSASSPNAVNVLDFASGGFSWADDHTAMWQAAIDAAVGAGGKFFATGPAPDESLGRAFNVQRLYARSGMRLGAEHRMRFRQDPASYAPVLSPVADGTTIEHVRLNNLILDADPLGRTPGTATPGALHFYKVTDLIAWDCEFWGLGYGIGAQGRPTAVDVNKRGPQLDIALVRPRLMYCGWGRRSDRTAVLAAGVSDSDTTFTFTDASLLDQSGGTIVIGTERIRHGAIVANSTTVIRGVCGSTAASHTTAETVYRSGNSDGIDVKYADGLVLDNPYAEGCSDKGMDPRALDCLMIRPRVRKGVTGVSINSSYEDTNVTVWLNELVTKTDSPTTLDITTESGLLPTGFPAAGVAGVGHIDCERVAWTGWTDQTGGVYRLTGVTRGLRGTYQAAHALGDTLTVENVDSEKSSTCTIRDAEVEDCALSGMAINSSGGSSTSRVVVDGARIRRCGTGINAKGTSPGRISLSLDNIHAYANAGDGIYVTQIDELAVGKAFTTGNEGYGARLVDQDQGGHVAALVALDNGLSGIVESGKTDHVRWGAGCSSRGNARISGSQWNLNTLTTDAAQDTRGPAFYVPEKQGFEALRAMTVVASAYTPGVVADGASHVQARTATGATSTDACVPILQSGTLVDGIIVDARVKANNQVVVTLLNRTGSSQTIGSLTWAFLLFKRVSPG